MFSADSGMVGHNFAAVYILDRATGEIIERIGSGGTLHWMTFAENALLVDGNGFGTIEICVHPLTADYHTSGPPWCFGPDPAEEDYEREEVSEGDAAEEIPSEETEETGRKHRGETRTKRAEEDEEEEEVPPWPPYVLNTAAVSPSSRWIAYVGSWGEHPVRTAVGRNRRAFAIRR